MNAGTTHPSTEELLAYSRGLLSPERASAVEAHLSNCEKCSRASRGLSSAPTVKAAVECQDETHSETKLGGGASAAKERLENHERYELLECIGAGGMGEVYRARHRVMDRDVAIKLIKDRRVRSTAAQQRFEREVLTAAKLSHPNVVTAFDAEQVGAEHFMVMEFVDGVNLAQVVASRGPLDVVEACEFVCQAAQGLQYAHEQGMVHRDIKPHNLMLTAGGEVKILDFGIASLARARTLEDETVACGDDLTMTGKFIGTPDFAAPEQIDNASDCDERGDIYSLGMTLYFLLAGEAPFGGRSASGKMDGHRFEQPARLCEKRTDFPPQLQSVVDKMIAKPTQERYQSAAEVFEALSAFRVEQSGVQGLATRLGLRLQRKLVAALISVAAIVLGTLYYIRTNAATVCVALDSEVISVVLDDLVLDASGGLPVELSTAAGDHRVSVRHRGRELIDKELVFGRGEQVQLSAELRGDKLVLLREGERIASSKIAAERDSSKLLAVTESEEIQNLKGTWQSTLVEQSGHHNDYVASGTRFVFRRNQLVTSRFNDTEVTRFRLDTAVRPKQIDLLDSVGNVRRGIYELANDTLCICLSSDQERPLSFSTSKVPERNTLMRFRRVSPSDPKTQRSTYEASEIQITQMRLKSPAMNSLTLEFQTAFESDWFCPGVRINRRQNEAVELTFVRAKVGESHSLVDVDATRGREPLSKQIQIPWEGEAVFLVGLNGRKRLKDIDRIDIMTSRAMQNGCRISGGCSQTNVHLMIENESDSAQRVHFWYQLVAQSQRDSKQAVLIASSEINEKIAPGRSIFQQFERSASDTDALPAGEKRWRLQLRVSASSEPELQEVRLQHAKVGDLLDGPVTIFESSLGRPAR